MPRLKPALKFARYPWQTLRPEQVLSHAPVLPSTTLHHVRLLPGWEVVGWTKFYNPKDYLAPPTEAMVYRKVECRPAPTHTEHGPGIWWHPCKLSLLTFIADEEPTEIPNEVWRSMKSRTLEALA